MKRMAGMLTKVGVRTCTLRGFLASLTHERLYMTSPRGALDATGSRSGAEGDLAVSGVGFLPKAF